MHWDSFVRLKYMRFYMTVFQSIYFVLQRFEVPTLQNVSFTVGPEQLLAVIGPVGAGKVRSVLVSGLVTHFKHSAY